MSLTSVITMTWEENDGYRHYRDVYLYDTYTDTDHIGKASPENKKVQLVIIIEMIVVFISKFFFICDEFLKFILKLKLLN